MVVTVENMLLILSAEPVSNAAAVELHVVYTRAILGGQGISLLHEAIRLEDLDDDL